LEAKQERLARLDAEASAAKAKYKTELEWMRRQPQARQTKAKARIEAFYKLQTATKPRPTEASIVLGSADNRRIGGTILSVQNLSLRFGDKVILDDFSYDFCKGDRICISGANGCGKTTFVRLLTGELEPDQGTIVRGDTIKIGVYDQRGIAISDPEQSMLDYVKEQVAACESSATTPAILDPTNDARRLLKQFEFPSYVSFP
jgi:ABC transport system ATP-binding/permease protein